MFSYKLYLKCLQYFNTVFKNYLQKQKNKLHVIVL